MKAIVHLHISQLFEIDLSDYGHSKNQKFEELTQEEQNEITDSLRSEVVVDCEIKTILY